MCESKPLTYEEWHLKLTIYCRENPLQRYGQSVFNCLDEERPALARGIIDANMDPFYWNDDEVWEAILWVKDNWDKEEDND